MNLMHLIAKKDQNLVLGPGVKPLKQTVGGRIYSGLSLPKADGSIRLKTALRWYPLNTRPVSANWLGMVPGGDWNRFQNKDGRCAVKLAFVDGDGGVVAETTTELGPVPAPIPLPHLPGPSRRDQDEALDLVVSNASPSGETISLLVTETVPVEPLYAQATGLGVEIGPGPYPRILPGPGRDVFYVERETIEDFRKKYNFKGKFESLDSPEAQAFWSQVTLGRANDLPFEDDSLDFIFSADVVEHLVNPLGHFAYWRTKLKAGGRVLAIIPHIYGCSDYVNRPTKFSYWEEQFRKGGFEEQPDHHADFAAPRGLDPKKLFASGYSSHFSFFSTENLSEAMSFAVEELGYRGFNIYYAQNAKKIHFALYA